MNALSLDRRCRLLMDLADAGWLVIAPVGFHHAVPVVHGPRSNPVGETVVRAAFIAPLRHHIEIPVYSKELLAATAESRIGVKDPAGSVLEENAIAGKVLQPGISVLVVVEGAARRDLLGRERHIEVVVEIRVVGRDPPKAPTHPF